VGPSLEGLLTAGGPRLDLAGPLQADWLMLYYALLFIVHPILIQSMLAMDGLLSQVDSSYAFYQMLEAEPTFFNLTVAQAGHLYSI
jgi:hypothetical protein